MSRRGARATTRWPRRRPPSPDRCRRPSPAPCSTSEPRVIDHPLDPLDADEMRAAVDLLKQHDLIGASWRIASIELLEPAKDLVRAFVAGEAIQRAAVVVCWNRVDGLTHKAVLSLTDARVLSW